MMRKGGARRTVNGWMLVRLECIHAASANGSWVSSSPMASFAYRDHQLSRVSVRQNSGQRQKGKEAEAYVQHLQECPHVGLYLLVPSELHNTPRLLFILVIILI